MRRIPEPELMEQDAQARAYAEADFEQPHSLFVRLCRESWEGDECGGRVIDLGCGPADISVRIAKSFPDLMVDGVDGSHTMLKYGMERVRREGLDRRVHLFYGRLPQAVLPRGRYDAVISNSLLHHLRHPAVLWQEVMSCARPGARVFVMDLMRPAGESAAFALVDRYAAGEPEVLRHDFLRSLLAAYRPAEVREQLDAAGLRDFAVQVVSDRHLAVSGRIPGPGSG